MTVSPDGPAGARPREARAGRTRPTTATRSSTTTPGWPTRTTRTRSPISTAENAYTDARTAHLAGLRETIFNEIKSPHQGDRPVGAGPQGRVLVLHPHRRGQAVRHPLPAARSRPGETDAADHRRRQPLAGEEVLLDGNAAGRRLRVLRAGHVRRQPGRRTCWRTRSTSTATSGSPCGSRTCAPASCSPTSRRTSSTARPGRPTAHAVLPDRRRRLAARTRSGGTRSGTPAADDVLVLRGARRAVLGRRRADPVGGVHRSSTCSSKITSEVLVIPAGDPAARAGGGRARAGRASSTTSSTTRRRPVPDPAQRRRRGLRARLHRRPTRPATGTELIPHTPGTRLLGVDAFAGHIVVSLRRDGLTGLRVLPRRRHRRVRHRRSPSRSTRVGPGRATPSTTPPPSGCTTRRWSRRTASTTTTCAPAS